MIEHNKPNPPFSDETSLRKELPPLLKEVADEPIPERLKILALRLGRALSERQR